MHDSNYVLGTDDIRTLHLRGKACQDAYHGYADAVGEGGGFMTMPENRLAAFAKAQRLMLGLTQAEVAERMGPDVDATYVTKIERGTVKVPQQPFLGMFARALAVSEVDILRAAGVITEPPDRVEEAEDPRKVLLKRLVDEVPLSSGRFEALHLQLAGFLRTPPDQAGEYAPPDDPPRLLRVAEDQRT